MVQFLSDPRGGSDLAGVTTRATRDGDVFILSGSKIWSSGAYAADYAVLQLKMNKNNGADALGSVTSYYGTALKDGKMEIFTDQPQVETCVHSLVPHSGHRTCWYDRRNNVKPIG